AGAFPSGSRLYGFSSGIPKPHACHDHRARRGTSGATMSRLSRRKLITTGLTVTASASGLFVAAELAKRYGLIPPDSGGIYGPGETLNYAAQRLLTRHSLAREFSRSQISKNPFANEVAPFNDAFKRHQANQFADWRLAVDGMVVRPGS